MKYNVRDPQTGRFIKKAVAAPTSECKCSCPRDPVTGRFVKKSCCEADEPKTYGQPNEIETVSETPAWKLEFDKQMAIFNQQMEIFRQQMDIFNATVSEY